MHGDCTNAGRVFFVTKEIIVVFVKISVIIRGIFAAGLNGSNKLALFSERLGNSNNHDMRFFSRK